MALLYAWSMRVDKYGFTHGVVKRFNHTWSFLFRAVSGYLVCSFEARMGYFTMCLKSMSKQAKGYFKVYKYLFISKYNF